MSAPTVPHDGWLLRDKRQRQALALVASWAKCRRTDESPPKQFDIGDYLHGNEDLVEVADRRCEIWEQGGKFGDESFHHAFLNHVISACREVVEA
jgi:hypothetical protein